MKSIITLLVCIINFAVFAQTEGGVTPAAVKSMNGNPGTKMSHPVEITPGHRGTFFNPATSGQGVLIDIDENANQMFLAWFTYDTDDSAGKSIGSAGQRWFSAQGAIDGNPLTLTVFSSSGGVFDNPKATESVDIGTVIIEYFTCDRLEMDYEIEPNDGSIPLGGIIDLIRLIDTDSCVDP